MQRQDTCDFLQLLMTQPQVLEPNSVPWGWWGLPSPTAQPSPAHERWGSSRDKLCTHLSRSPGL